MKIGFVAEPYEEHKASGMGHVMLELMRHLPQEGPRHQYVFYTSQPINRELVPGNYENVVMPPTFVGKMIFFFFLKDKLDVLMFMVPLLPLYVRSVKTIALCQDLVSHKIPPRGMKEKLVAFVRDQVLTRLALRRARHVIVASGSTKRDLAQIYGVPDSKMTVVYDGFQDLRMYESEAPAVHASIKPYFLAVGKVKYRKNIHGIVDAFIRLKKRTGAQCNLVVAGDYSGEYYEKIVENIRANNMSQHVLFLGYTTGATLYSYYRHAHACVFPSFNEGFGMPIVEAMSLDVPVITSNVSSMTEVAGDAGILVDPNDVEDISNAMERVLLDDRYRNQFIEKGRIRARQFSWPFAAREHLRVAEDLGCA